MTELIDRVSAAMVCMKMPCALKALSHTLRRLEQGELTAVKAIDALLSGVCALRETRRIDIALRTAKLLPVRMIESFDFAFQPSVDRERIAPLAQLDFIRRRETVHFLGPPGTGKFNLTTAIGVADVKAGKSVYKTTLAELTDGFEKAGRQGLLAEKIRFFARAALLIVDEIGCLPISKGGASLFIQIVNASYEKGAMILTSNRSFAEWGDIFGAPSSRRPSATGSTTQWSSEPKAKATDSGNTPTSFPNMSAPMHQSRRHLRKNEGGPKRRPVSTIELARRQNIKTGECCFSPSWDSYFSIETWTARSSDATPSATGTKRSSRSSARSTGRCRPTFDACHFGQLLRQQTRGRH